MNPDPQQSSLIYGHLTVRSTHRDPRTRHRVAECTCRCGTQTVVRVSDLTSGRVVSCGCVNRTKNGQSRSPTYWSWVAMKRRCTDPTFVSYPGYGGAGVTVDPRWVDEQTGFQTFVAEVGERPKGKTLDRKDPFGNYEPGNVQWATAQQQEQNKRWRYSRQAADGQASENAHWDEMEREYLENDI